MSEPLVSFEDVSTIMRLLAEIADDVADIRGAVVEDDGEEEDPEADA